MPKPEEVLDTLQQLEDELRRMAWWEATPPPPEALSSRMPFHADHLTLAQWLQWVFLPRMRLLMEHGASPPGPCAIAPAAELAWEDHPDATAVLLPLLRRIDRMLTELARTPS